MQKVAVSVVTIIALLVGGSPVTSPVFAQKGEIDVVSVIAHPTDPSAVFGVSQLLRTDGGVAFTLDTTGLVAGSAYTLWGFVDDSPANLPGPPGRESFEIRLWLAGGFADLDGKARFSGFLPIGDLPPVDGKSVMAIDDGSFDDSMESKIMLIVRQHGPAIPEMEFEQTHYLNGGCLPGEPNEGKCQLIQEALHSGSGAPVQVFVRGDCNGDGVVDVSDTACALNWLFVGPPKPGCVAALNTNGDARVDIADPVSLLDYLFNGGPPPVHPYPDCGPGALPADEQLACVNSPNCQ